MFRQGLIHQYRWLLSRLQWLLDGAVVVLLLVWFCRLYGTAVSQSILVLGIIAFVLTLFVFQGSQLYRPWRGANFMLLVRKVVLAWLIVTCLLLAVGFATKMSYKFSRAVLLSWMVLTPLVMVVIRYTLCIGLHWARSMGMNSRTVVIAGAGSLGKRLADNVLETPWLGMKLRGFFDDHLVDKEIELQPGKKSIPVLGNLYDMVNFVQKNKIDMVYLALPLRAENRLRDIVNSLQDTTTSVYLVPDVFTFRLLQAKSTDLRGIPLISLWETPFYGLNRWLKKLEDIVMASIIILPALPSMLIIALGIKLTSPGPILFKQRRYGLDGEEIIVYKFRTMTVCEDGAKIPQAKRNDRRITRFGAFLRQTSLDELPQFINVLEGKMSIVGPRPHAVAHNEYYRRVIPGYMLRHKVKPSITGWAQINGWRGETDTLEKMEKRLEFDMEYLRRWSLWFDLKIIFLTVMRGFTDKAAY